jgi:hypothetical protein
MTLMLCQARPSLTHGPSPVMTEALSIIVQECLHRARRWPTPPQWEFADWLRELAAQAERAAVEALAKPDAEAGSSPSSFLVCQVMARLLVRHRREWLHAGHLAEITFWPDETHADCCSFFIAGPESGTWGTHEDFIDVMCQVRELDPLVASELSWQGPGRKYPT